MKIWHQIIPTAMHRKNIDDTGEKRNTRIIGEFNNHFQCKSGLADKI